MKEVLCHWSSSSMWVNSYRKENHILVEFTNDCVAVNNVVVGRVIAFGHALQLILFEELEMLIGNGCQ